MKICVSSTGKNLDAPVDDRFGRCRYFLIIDTDTMDVEAILNENIMAIGGAGIQAAQRIAEEKVSSVLTGNIGPNAFQTLKSAEIEVITGVKGIVKDAVEKYKKGEFQESIAPSAESHSGLGSKELFKGGRYQ